MGRSLDNWDPFRNVPRHVACRRELWQELRCFLELRCSSCEFVLEPRRQDMREGADFLGSMACAGFGKRSLVAPISPDPYTFGSPF